MSVATSQSPQYIITISLLSHKPVHKSQHTCIMVHKNVHVLKYFAIPFIACGVFSWLHLILTRSKAGPTAFIWSLLYCRWKQKPDPVWHKTTLHAIMASWMNTCILIDIFSVLHQSNIFHIITTYFPWIGIQLVIRLIKLYRCNAVLCMFVCILRFLRAMEHTTLWEISQMTCRGKVLIRYRKVFTIAFFSPHSSLCTCLRPRNLGHIS